MKVVKVVPGRPFAGNHRDERELEVLYSLGCEITVVCSYREGVDNSKYPYDFLYEDYMPLSKFIKHRGLNYRLTKYFTAYKISRLNPDIISGHDLLGLKIGWWSSLFKFHKPKLVYDSHEFTYGQASAKSWLHRAKIKFWESLILPKCSMVIEVNDSISDAVQKLYGLKKRPVTIRSTPNNWRIDKEEILKNRKEFLSANKLSDNTFLLVTLGRIVYDNGIKEAVEVISKTKGTALLILGPYSMSSDLNKSKDWVQSLGVEDRVIFHDAVPQDDIWRLAGMADASLCLINNNNTSFYLSLPNKLFESIQSLVPIIGSNFPEIANIINGYGIGECCNPSNIDEIVSAIDKIKGEKSLLQDNLEIAKSELSWENESEKLLSAYKNIIQS